MDPAGGWEWATKEVNNRLVWEGCGLLCSFFIGLGDWGPNKIGRLDYGVALLYLGTRKVGNGHGRGRYGEGYKHRLNMELDLQSLFGLHVHSCPHWLRHRHSHHPPAFGLIYEGAIGQPRQTTSLFDPLVTKDRNGRWPKRWAGWGCCYQGDNIYI
jgi:hypothetical protein